VVEQSLLHYNGMFLSPYELFSAKQAEVEAQRGYLQAWRDYWIARAELERAVGGALPSSTSPPLPEKRTQP
jgi:cobalt-zinc-cadmium efflux system outer membrane protein